MGAGILDKWRPHSHRLKVNIAIVGILAALGFSE